MKSSSKAALPIVPSHWSRRGVGNRSDRQIGLPRATKDTKNTDPPSYALTITSHEVFTFDVPASQRHGAIVHSLSSLRQPSVPAPTRLCLLLSRIKKVWTLCEQPGTVRPHTDLRSVQAPQSLSISLSDSSMQHWIICSSSLFRRFMPTESALKIGNLLPCRRFPIYR